MTRSSLRRPMSAGELRELYGMPIRQLRSSEEVFRKDAFKRDKQKLKMIVQAINNEQKQVERKWDLTMSKFVRDHAEFVYHMQKNKRVIYRKVSTVSSQPEKSVPPCIPFVGTFPPSRHPNKDRRVSEMFKEPLFSRNSCHELGGIEHGEAGEETENRNRTQDNYSYFLANQRVVNSFGSTSMDASRISIRSDGTIQERSVTPSDSRPTHVNTNNRNGHQENTRSVMIHSKQSHCNSVSSQEMENSSFRKSNTYNSLDNRQHTHDNTDSNNNNGNHQDVDIFPLTNNINMQHMDNTRSQLVNRSSMTTNGMKTEEQVVSGNNNQSSSNNINDTPGSQQSQSDRTTEAESHQSHTDKDKEDADQEKQDTLSRRSSTERSDATSEFLDVELLQQALMEHSRQNLIRNRWRTAMKRIMFHSNNGHKGEGPHHPQNGDSLMGSTVSLASVSTPTTRTATDISDNEHDANMMIMQVILQVFKELDQSHPINLTELWPTKMENLMVTIEDVVRSTGVEITKIVEKIQKGDIHDPRCAALLDWVRDVDNTAAEQETGKGPTAKTWQYRHKVSSTSGTKMDTDRTVLDAKENGSSAEHEGNSNAQRNSQSFALSLAVRKAPIIHIVPPSRKQSTDVATENHNTRRQSIDVAQYEVETTVTSHTEAADKQSNMYPRTSNDAALFYRRNRPNSFHDQVEFSNIPSSSLPLFGDSSSEREHISTGSTKLPHVTSQQSPRPTNTSIKKTSIESHSLTDEDQFLPSVTMKPSPRFGHTADKTHPARAKANCSGKRLSVSRSAMPIPTDRKSKPVSPNLVHSEVTRTVSLSTHRKTNSASSSLSSTKGRHVNSQDEHSSSNQRSPTVKVTKSFSTESHDSQHSFPRRRVASTGQQCSGKRVSQGTLLTRRKSGEETRGRSRSFSSVSQRLKSSERRDLLVPSPQNVKTAFEDFVDHGDRVETTETLMHTDRRGKTHRLTMRKVSISASMREANVTVTREDTKLQSQQLQRTKDITENYQTDKTEGLNEHAPSSLHETFETMHDEVLLNDHSSQRSGDDKDGKTGSPRQEIPVGLKLELARIEPEIREEPDEDEALWRNRLSHPEGMAWVSELSSDHKAQGLALSLLHRKEGGGLKFRSTVLKVICVNALRAAKSVYDDVTFREMKQCRYLRMPQTYASDEQRELSLNEIFS